MREGIQLSEALTGDGGRIFRHACAMASKASSRSASAPGWRTRAWLKTKNPCFQR